MQHKRTMEQTRGALSTRRGSECVQITLGDRRLDNARLEIYQLQRNKTILSILAGISAHTKHAEESYVVTVRLVDSRVEIYTKPTRRHLFPGKVTLARVENVVYRWVCSQQEVRVCYYTNSLTDRPTTLKGRLLLAGCNGFPTKDTRITL